MPADEDDEDDDNNYDYDDDGDDGDDGDVGDDDNNDDEYGVTQLVVCMLPIKLGIARIWLDCSIQLSSSSSSSLS